MITYTIDNTDFKSLGVWVRESTGVVDLPKPKAVKSHSWSEYHGSVVDLREVKLEERVINLDCFIKASSPEDFMSKLNAFQSLLSGGFKRLQIDVTEDTTLIFDCYLSAAIAVKKKWSEHDMAGEFSVRLTEPEPLKKVIRFDGTEFLIGFSTSDAVQIFYGDGTKSKDLWGEVSIKYTYKEHRTRYITIHGNIDKITDLSTNGEVIWER